MPEQESHITEVQISKQLRDFLLKKGADPAKLEEANAELKSIPVLGAFKLLSVTIETITKPMVTSPAPNTSKAILVP